METEGFHIQIYSSNTTTFDLAEVKAQKMEEVKLNKYFSKIIEESDDGFFFEKDIDGDIRYDFRRFRVIGDTEYTFQKGILGNYTMEEVKKMYSSTVKS